MKYLFICLSVIVFIVLLYIFVILKPTKKKSLQTELLCDYAHRGLHGNGRPENSISAFSAAIEKGVGFELDLQLSKDGKVMVFHDYTLKRMTGNEGKLGDTDSDLLAKMALGGTDNTIPTFEDVLALNNGRVPMLIELKGENANSRLCPAVAAVLKDYKGPYCIESFNPLLLMSMRKYLPDALYGQLYTNVCKNKKKYTPLNILLTLMAFNPIAKPHFIAYDQKFRRSLPVLITTKLFKAPRFVWTVKTNEEYAAAKASCECAIFENI